MRYIDVKWLHQNPEYPIRLVSEIDSDGYEIRSWNFYRMVVQDLRVLPHLNWALN